MEVRYRLTAAVSSTTGSAYYYANQAEIDADLETEARETEILEQQHRR